MQNRRILLVDDDRDIQDTMKLVLNQPFLEPDLQLGALEEVLFDRKSPPPHAPTKEEPRYIIDSAYQGQEALEMILAAIKNNTPYLFVFMDMRMPPGWDGVRTIQEIRRVDPSVEIVIVSAYFHFPLAELAKLAGSPESILMLRKPFDCEDLQHVARALARKWILLHQPELSNSHSVEGELSQVRSYLQKFEIPPPLKL